MELGLMFFSGSANPAGGARYRMLLEASRLADEAGFRCVWVPERHFHEFGGLFPNPAVVGAALAAHTCRVEIRAGSLISPLHDTLRIAEDFAVVDNLSSGRVAISFGSGWNIRDFVLAPQNYAQRQAIMYRQIEEVKALWRGEPAFRRDSNGREIEVRIYPPPVQAELPVWVTSSGDPRTFAAAGASGANLLTHLLGQAIEELAEKIAVYRQARRAGGLHAGPGTVSLMLHTFLGEDLAAARAAVRRPFREYIRSALSLEKLAALDGGVISGGHRVDPHDIPPAAVEELLDLACERYLQGAALIGTEESCRRLVWAVEAAGVDEIACLVDFVDDVDAVLASLRHLDRLRIACSVAAAQGLRQSAVASFLDELGE
jgi:natural product biosynthesis luciferase-like monooxygenase protein